jgi:hypothetical protein
VHGGEIRGVGHRGLVDDDQVAGAELPVRVVAECPAGGEALLDGEPLADVAAPAPN